MPDPNLCERCQERPTRAKGLCSRCYQAMRREEEPELLKARKRASYGRHREEWNAASRARRAGAGPRLCRQCKERPPVPNAKGLCSPCYQAARQLCDGCKERLAATMGLCDRCYRAERIKAQPELYRARRRASYERHREEQLARDRAYQAEHRGQIVAHKRAWYDENRERIKASARAYRSRNRERIRANARAYYSSNRERINARARAYYAARRETIGASIAEREFRGTRTS